MSEKKKIRKLLLASIVAGSIYGGGALLFGLLVSYNVLLLDGVYTLIGAVMSLIALYVAKYIQAQDFERFPFGKEALMPLVVFIQYNIILLISIYGIIESAFSLLHVSDGMIDPIGLYFSLVGTIYCFSFYLYLKKKPLTHPFYWVELEQWRFGFFFSLGVVGSFLVSWLIQASPYGNFAMYVDPIISIGITLFFIQLSIKELKAAILELTSSTPKEELRETIMTIVEKELRAEEVVDFVLRTAKVGNQVIVELDVVILPATPLDTVGQQDPLRERLNQAISQQISGYSLWLNINFVGDIKWAYSEE
ncbi:MULTISPECIES: cation transporter [Enterococcus]|uniref:cation transporter n=1 Tax=Enterococcus TaxID=1350 RepID=UPI0023313211|nr:cation transporter [Enterococcus casseliflavus]MDB1690827.1 cation transporter [Enterococcus casseliflavus]